ncbi:hypothetical protein TcYC6_0102490 [Trypanosoma cruzi]|nr:hypothetical protein TcYC6_0102390 [Trypanosoma cruzi]KAF8294420.1 hypothetical protein TcYC6_0102490 [Trypanosoma cruzi]RNC33802.1 amino acid transporter [Trypanosoma cruzi]RNC51311.1 amino acid transporter [Trypanosoma cruzi]
MAVASFIRRRSGAASAPACWALYATMAIFTCSLFLLVGMGRRCKQKSLGPHFRNHRRVLGELEPYSTYCESPGTSSDNFRDSIAPSHRVETARELGVRHWLITAERERLSNDCANAVADVQNRNAQLYSHVEEAHNDLSARESHIAVASGLLAGRGDAVSRRSAHLSERAAR